MGAHGDGRRRKAFLYQFTHVPPSPNAKAWGAYHGSEIAYVFGNLRNPTFKYTETDRVALGDDVQLLGKLCKDRRSEEVTARAANRSSLGPGLTDAGGGPPEWARSGQGSRGAERAAPRQRPVAPIPLTAPYGPDEGYEHNDPDSLILGLTLG